MTRVFLGGTLDNSRWRFKMIMDLQEFADIEWYSPSVEWSFKIQEKENNERSTCDFIIYLVTPIISGLYSVAEVIDDSNKRPNKTILILPAHGDTPYSEKQYKSLQAIADMVRTNGAKVFYTYTDVAEYIANYKE